MASFADLAARTNTRVSARLFDVTGGRVLVDGVDVRELDPDLLWSRIGLVPQDLAIYEDLSATHNLRLFGALYGLTGATLDEYVSELLMA